MAQTVKSFGMQTSNTAETPLGDGVEPGNPKGEIYVVNGTSFQVYYEEELPTDHRLLTQVNDALERIRKQAQTDFNRSAERFVFDNAGHYDGLEQCFEITYRTTNSNLPTIYYNSKTEEYTSYPKFLVLTLPEDAFDPNTSKPNPENITKQNR